MILVALTTAAKNDEARNLLEKDALVRELRTVGLRLVDAADADDGRPDVVADTAVKLIEAVQKMEGKQA